MRRPLCHRTPDRPWSAPACAVRPCLTARGEQVFGAQSDDTQHGWRQPMALGQNFGDDLLLRAFISRQSIGALETLEAAYPRCDMRTVYR